MREFLLNSHFVDDVSYAKYIGVDKFNVRQFEAAQTIKARVVKKSTVIKNAGNEDVVSNITIYTFTKVDELDQINGKDILSITEWKSLLDNKVVGYIVRI